MRLALKKRIFIGCHRTVLPRTLDREQASKSTGSTVSSHSQVIANSMFSNEMSAIDTRLLSDYARFTLDANSTGRCSSTSTTAPLVHATLPVRFDPLVKVIEYSDTYKDRIWYIDMGKEHFCAKSVKGLLQDPTTRAPGRRAFFGLSLFRGPHMLLKVKRRKEQPQQ